MRVSAILSLNTHLVKPIGLTKWVHCFILDDVLGDEFETMHKDDTTRCRSSLLRVG